MFDVDDMRAWSEGLLEFLEHFGDQERNTFTDLEVVKFLNLLDDREINLYHASRLTPFEIQDIKSNGIVPASLEFLTKKLSQVHEQGLINQVEFRELLETGKKSLDSEEYRSDQICLLIGSEALNLSDYKLNNFWNLWGGEIININLENLSLKQKLREIGCPVTIKLRVSNFLEIEISEKVFVAALKTYQRKPESISVHLPAIHCSKLRVIDVIFQK